MEDDFDVFLALLAHIVQVQLFIFLGLKKIMAGIYYLFELIFE